MSCLHPHGSLGPYGGFRLAGLVIAALACIGSLAAPARAQQPSQPSKEYVRAGGKLIAIEIPGAGGIWVQVSPTSVSLGQSQQQQFAATVHNSGNQSVTWSRSPALGSINTSTGLYTAPATITVQQNVTITATSVADPTKSGSATVTLIPPAGNSPPSVVSAFPTNTSGWANVFTYTFSDPNGATDISEVEISYSESTGPPFANSCWFVYTRSTNQMRLRNDAGSGYVTGSITPGSTSGNLSNARCTLIGGSLSVADSGNTFTVRIGIGFATGTYRSYTTRLFARDVAAATSGWISSGTWVIPTANGAPYGPGASGSGSQSISMNVWLSDPNNVSVSQIDLDDIQTLISNSSGSTTNACHFYYFAPADSIVLMAANGITWAGVTKVGTGGTTINNSLCSINGAAVTKSYTSGNQRLTVTVPITAMGGFSGFKYVYVGGSDRPGTILSTQYVHYWDIW